MRLQDRNPNREIGLRRQESADAIVPRPLTWEGQNDKEDRNLDSLRDEQGKPNSPNGETAEQPNEVKPRGVVQRAEPFPAPTANTG